jgi:plasmid stabilization system protein ParE
VKVVWSNRALSSLSGIHARISEEADEATAHRIVNRILGRGDQLASFPYSGRIVERHNRPGIRELIESPYRVIYKVTSQEIQIIDIFHSAQLPPWER